jgi:predicted esterase
VYDPIIGVEWGRQAREQLQQAGAEVLYREYPLPHAVDPAFLVELRPWLRSAVAATTSLES